jgi:hypothetical protein
MQLSPFTSFSSLKPASSLKPTLQRSLANHSTIAPPPSTQREGIQAVKIVNKNLIPFESGISRLNEAFPGFVPTLIPLERANSNSELVVFMQQKGRHIKSIWLAVLPKDVNKQPSAEELKEAKKNSMFIKVPDRATNYWLKQVTSVADQLMKKNSL